MPREQLQFTESCHFQNLSKTKPLNVTDLAVDPRAKEHIENPELKLHMSTDMLAWQLTQASNSDY